MRDARKQRENSKEKNTSESVLFRDFFFLDIYNVKTLNVTCRVRDVFLQYISSNYKTVYNYRIEYYIFFGLVNIIIIDMWLLFKTGNWEKIFKIKTVNTGKQWQQNLRNHSPFTLRIENRSSGDLRLTQSLIVYHIDWASWLYFHLVNFTLWNLTYFCVLLWRYKDFFLWNIISVVTMEVIGNNFTYTIRFK